MAECEAPTFSLGLDLGLDSEHPAHEFSPRSPINPGASARMQDEDELGAQVIDSDPEMGPDPPTRILKRLRRGLGGGSSSSSSVQKQEERQSCIEVDDDIEEFSSQDDLVEVQARPSTGNHSLCSSSKVPLNGCGVLASHSSSNWKERKRKHGSDIPSSGMSETGKSGLIFPKLTASPLRRFQLLDSDSDDPVNEDVSGTRKIDSCSKEPTCNKSKYVTSFEQNGKATFRMNQNQDLWKDFSPVKSFSIPTPALNELCDEYFHSAKDKEVEKSGIDVSHNKSFLGVTSSCLRDEQLWDSADPLPPAHRYFFHEDPRIQKLVRNRLCNFSPLGVNRTNQQPNASSIDYMRQFSSGDGSRKQAAQKGYVEKSSARGRKKLTNLTVEEAFHASAGWVDPKIISSFSNEESSKRKATKRNSKRKSISKGKSKLDKSNSSGILHTTANWVEPKSCAYMPKDAGKRRVQASGKSVGHWYTGSDGRKVYVTGGGQELTGQTAYRHYRKESGSGSKKSKKKTSATKKRK